MKSLRDFENLVQPHVVGCPPLVVREAIKESLDSFFIKTNMWQIDLPSDGIIAGISDYDFNIESYLRVVSVMAIKFQGNALMPITPQDINESSLNLMNAAEGGTPQFYSMHIDDDAQFIRIYPTPLTSIPASLNERVSVKLKSNANDYIPDFIYEDWRRVISSGALAKLFAIPGKAWASPELSVYHESIFQAGMGKAMDKLYRGSSQKRLRVKNRIFGE